jgi:hypothetical protein
LDAKTLVVDATGAKKPGAKTETAAKTVTDDNDSDDSDLDPQQQAEDQERAIAAAALYAETSMAPSQSIQYGPGMLNGPLRFLPPQKRIHLYWEYVGWCQASETKGQPASLNTFLRAYRAGSNKLRIRKAGTHALCDKCLALKQAIRGALCPNARKEAMERYTEHILRQWLDRQIYWHAQSLSCQLRTALTMGQKMESLARNASQACLIVDGIDQAKFRIPRVLEKGHSLDKLLRPALHVQGAWCHGFGYHLAVSDADMKKDTNNNVEVIARMLSALSVAHGCLPASLHLQQDNTSRECKNQNIVKWAAKVVALGVFESVTLSYLITGHTHENIDGTFGQLTVKLSASEFSDDKEVLRILQGLLRDLGIDAGSRAAAMAYKLDEAANWVEWWSELDLCLSSLTGPDAPHWFRVCRLRDLGLAAGETDVPRTSPPGMTPHENPHDVVMTVKDRMASSKVDQVVRLVPAETCMGLRIIQPEGTHERRPGGLDVKRNIIRVAKELRDKGSLKAEAADYLIGWAQGSREKEPRPQAYEFLSNSCRRFCIPGQLGPICPAAPAAKARARLPRELQPARPVRVQIKGTSGHPLAILEDADEEEAGPLVVGGHVDLAS